MVRSNRSVLARRSALAALLLAGLSSALPATAADDSNEKEHLAAVIRQLDLLDRLAKQSAAIEQERARYHFDYTRLAADLQRMRVGINDYLTPQRAQPRDPAALQGDYRQDSEQEPKK